MGAQARWDVVVEQVAPVVEQVAPVVVSLVVVVVASVLVIRLRFWGYDQEEKMVERHYPVGAPQVRWG